MPSDAAHADDAQLMEELLEELGEDSVAAGDLAACTGSSSSKKRMRHINNERQRRLVMNNLLDSLQALLPDPHPRKDRCALLSDVIAHIRSLEEEMQELSALTAQLKSRAKPPARIVLSPASSSAAPTDAASLIREVHVQFLQPTMAGSEPSIERNRREEMIITFHASLPTRGVFPHVVALLQENQVEVITASLCTTPADSQMQLYYIHATIYFHQTWLRINH